MKVKQYESRERRFINYYINNKCLNCKAEYISPEGSFDNKDFIFYSGRTTLNMGEVKVRDIDHNKYDTAIIQVDKVYYLTNQFLDCLQQDERAKLLYFAVYPKTRTIMVFDMMNTPSTITMEWCDKVTAKPELGKVKKPMVNYKYEDALQIIKF